MHFRLPVLFPFVLSLSLGCYHASSQPVVPEGGQLFYENKGTPQAPNKYEVTLVLYLRDSSGVGSGVTAGVSSSCYADRTLNMKPFVGTAFPAGINCSNTLSPDSLKLFTFYFRDTVTLPGPCTDYIFSYRQCCRSIHTGNLVKSDSTAFCLTAGLNNTMGPNTSPEFLSPFRYLFCKNISNYMSYATIEPDGDSIFYRLTTALDSIGDPVNYETGYDFDHPLPAVNPFLQISKGGFTTFNPYKTGVYTVVMEAVEYRFNSLGWLKVGSARLDMNFTITDSCQWSVSVFDSLGSGKRTYIAHCGDSVISLHVSPIISRSLATDASDFRLVGGDTVLRPLLGAGIYNGILYTDSIWLRLYQPLTVNDTLTLYLKKGGDGNTLIGYCGNEFPEFDQALVIVSDCQTSELNENDIVDRVLFYPNPVQDLLTIETGDYLRLINIFDLQGHMLKTIIPEVAKTELDISGFPKGVYVLYIETDQEKVIRLVEKL